MSCISSVPPEKNFLFEIVANKRNGIDVDKKVSLFSKALHQNLIAKCRFDYIARDTHAISNGTDIDLIRYVFCSRSYRV